MHNPHNFIFSKLEKVAIGTSFILALALGVLGFSQYYLLQSQSASLFDILYGAVGLFLLQANIDPGNAPVALEIARWLAPASISYTAFKAVTTVLTNRLELLKLSKLDAHTIICGLNSVSVRIIKTIVSSDTSVVVIEANSQSKYFGLARRLGANILVGNPCDITWLNHANVQKASFLLADTNSDHSNLEVAYHCYKQRLSDESLPMLKCAIHIDSRETTEVLYQLPIFSVDENNYSARIINHEDIAARWLLNEYGPNYLVDRSTVESKEIVIAIIGNGNLIEKFLWRLASIGHYGQLKPISVNLIATDASAKLDYLSKSQPALFKILNISAHDTHFGVLNSPDSHEVFSRICPDVIYTDALNTEQALSSIQTLKGLHAHCPIVVCESGDGVIPDLLEQQLQKDDNIHCIKVMHKSCHFDSIFNVQQDTLAMKIHENYVNSQIDGGDALASNSSLVEWKLLPENLKDANRNQADHFYIKCLALTGKKQPTVAEIKDALNTENIEKIAKMEHNRWKAQKELNGWNFHQGDKDNVRRLSPSLVAWEKLTDQEKDKDRDAVYLLPELARLHGQMDQSR